jgi:hypothetical protein
MKKDLYAEAAANIFDHGQQDQSPTQPQGDPSPNVDTSRQPAEGGQSVMDYVGQSVQGAYDLWQSVGAGVGDAALETKDFLVGEPAQGDKSQFRQDWEERSQQLRDQSLHNSIAHDVSQFATGMIGAGRLLAPIKVAQKLKTAGKAGKLVYEVAQGAIAGSVVIDPHERRLSDLVQQYDSLQNPVTEFLASDPNDSASMGRFKNALEGIGMDLALAGVFAASVKAVKYFRAGDEAAARAALKEAEKLQFKADNADAIKAAGDAPDSLKPKVEKVRSEASAVPAKDLPQKYEPKVQIEEADSAAIIQAARDDTEAISKYGSREAALAEGHQFSNVNLPWQKLNSSAETQALVENTAATLKEQYAKIKGGAVLKDTKVAEMVRSTAELFGEDPDVVMGTISRAGEHATTMVADMEAAYIISRKAFEEAAQLASKIENGLLKDFGGDVVAAQKELLRRHQVAADMMAHGASMRAAAGRSVRRNRAAFAITKADIEAFGSIPPERLSQVLASTKGDIAKLRQTVNPTFWRRVMDESTFLLTNNLLWNWTTHAVNTTTNLYMLAARPTEKILGSLAQGSRGSAVRRQAMKEYAYTIASLGDAWQSLVDSFKKGDSILSPHTDEYFQTGSRVQVPQLSFKAGKDVLDTLHDGIVSANYSKIAEGAGDAAKGAYRVGVGAPTRALGAVDEFIKTLRYRSVIQARAAVEGTEAGLKGKALRDHIKKALDEAFDIDGRALDAEALSEAKVVTFQQDLMQGTFGKSVQNFRHNYPPTALILPFVKTPVNVLRYGWKMTPGLNLLQGEYRKMLSGSMGTEAQAHAVGQMALGSTFMSIASLLAMEGRVTGGGPSDFKLQKELMATGWQPYSIVFENDDGTKTYFPIGRFDPVGMVFGMAADIVDMQILHPNTKDAEKGASAVVVSLAKAFSEKTFLMNINQALRAITEPDKNMGKFLGNLAGNMIPGSSAIKNYVNGDPYLREARTYLDHTMKGMPGYSETLPPQRDSFGDPVWRKRGLATDSDLDLVDAEHTRIIEETGYGVRAPAARRRDLDLRDVTLHDGKNAYEVLQELAANPPGAPSLKSSLAKLIKSNAYAKLVDGDPGLRGTKLGAISDVVQKYREAAFKLVLKKYPELREELMKAQIDVKNAVEANKPDSGKTTDLESMLRSMNY